MPSHLVFITLFLGIVSGKQWIELQADANVASIRITLAGQEIARLTLPPWRSEIDLGGELVPRELQAIGFDANGAEVARVSQVLNLPHANADVQIVPADRGVQLRWTNLEFAAPKSAEVRFDGAKLRVDRNFVARFPEYADRTRPHVIEAELRFGDGVVARREIVVEGTRFAETAESEITPVLVTETASQHPQSLEQCFAIDGEPVRVSALEKEKAQVIFVQDPDPEQARRALDPAGRATNMFSRQEVARSVHFDNDTVVEVVWPVMQAFEDPSSNAVSRLFQHSVEYSAEKGLIAPLTTPFTLGKNVKRHFADAVVVAGSRALLGGRRRAVVLILTEGVGASGRDPRAIRRYLEAVGVPFFVWSPMEVTPDATASWGEVQDISSIDHLRDAVNRVRRVLAAQRVAWIHADAFTALRAHADPRCGFAVVR